MNTSESHREALFEDLNRETDRGCVLVAASYFEQALESLLRTKFSADSTAGKREIDDLLTAAMAPIGTLATRTKLAYALGLIDNDTRDSINDIRRIRNTFAHGTGKASLTSEAVDKIFSRLDPLLQELVQQMIDHYQAQVQNTLSSPSVSAHMPAGFSEVRMRLSSAVAVLYTTIEKASSRIRAQD